MTGKDKHFPYGPWGRGYRFGGIYSFCGTCLHVPLFHSQVFRGNFSTLFLFALQWARVGLEGPHDMQWAMEMS